MGTPLLQAKKSFYLMILNGLRNHHSLKKIMCANHPHLGQRVRQLSATHRLVYPLQYQLPLQLNPAASRRARHQVTRQEHQQGFRPVNHLGSHQDTRQEHQQGFLQVNHLGSHQDTRQEHQQGFLQVNHLASHQDTRQEHQQGFRQVNRLVSHQVARQGNRQLSQHVLHQESHLFLVFVVFRFHGHPSCNTMLSTLFACQQMYSLPFADFSFGPSMG
jgi:hypothetical protein